MANELQIPEFAVRAFDARWGHTVQQMVAKLREKVTVDAFGGKEKLYKDLSTLVWRERLTRLGDSQPQEIEGYKRKLSKRDFACQVIFDRKDKDYLQDELSKPGSETETAMRASWNRNVDEMIVAAVTATVYGGAEPYVTAITVPSSREVAVDYVHTGSTANSGLTPWKVINLKKKFELAEVFIDGEGSEEAFLAISPKQEEDLWAFVGADYKTEAWAQPLARFLAGETDKLFGFTVKKSNRLTLSASDVRTCVAWVKSAIMVAPENMQIRVDELPSKDHAIQLAGYADYGAMRRYEEKVGVIYCDESP
jgi:hypothetical protein